jgi:hypothetical protein
MSCRLFLSVGICYDGKGSEHVAASCLCIIVTAVALSVRFYRCRFYRCRFYRWPFIKTSLTFYRLFGTAGEIAKTSITEY